MRIPQATEQTLIKLEKSIYNLPKERLHVVSPKNKIVLTKDAGFPKWFTALAKVFKQENIIKDNDHIICFSVFDRLKLGVDAFLEKRNSLTHNHLIGVPPSHADIYTGFKYKLATVRAVTKEKDVYIVDYPKKITFLDRMRALKLLYLTPKISEQYETAHLLFHNSIYKAADEAKQKLMREQYVYARYEKIQRLLERKFPGLKFRKVKLPEN